MRRIPPAVNLLLFALTVVSTLLAGAQNAAPKTGGLWSFVAAGVPYCAALLAILLAHELGHYVSARIHRVDASLPFFIPLPLLGFGTLGAVIRIRSAIPSRKAVLDIGAAGPIAGFLVALPLLFWGLAHSTVLPESALASPNAAYQSPFTLIAALARKQSLPWPPTKAPLLMGDSLITWLAARLTHGGLATVLQINPIAYAAWIGMLVTAFNLTPIGQLDGGHVVYALFGRHGVWISRLSSWALLGLGVFASWTWFVWWALSRFVVGMGHPPASDEAPLSPARRAIAIFSLAILALTFLPVPLHL